MALNFDQRYEYMEQLRVQERFERLQAEYDVFQAQMESKLNASKKSVAFWKKLVVVYVVLFVLVKIFKM